MTPEQARRIVGEHMVFAWAADAGQLWEMYPEVGEDDFTAIIAQLKETHPYPDRYEEAYALLESRAEGVDT